MEENRIAIISIFVYERAASAQVNDLLSKAGEYVVGRMGIPYHEKNVNVISVVIDAPATVINSLTGKIGMIEGVTAKTLFSKL
ncbi:MAG: iron-only hydrogenase system regulator [Clostridia bacterium]|nr:iron-only hydrogenase system regulator [Clostridia bacterium]